MTDRTLRVGATLDNMLRDRLFCGISDGCIQRRLLAEPNSPSRRPSNATKQGNSVLRLETQIFAVAWCMPELSQHISGQLS